MRGKWPYYTSRVVWATWESFKMLSITRQTNQETASCLEGGYHSHSMQPTITDTHSIASYTIGGDSVKVKSVGPFIQNSLRATRWIHQSIKPSMRCSEHEILATALVSGLGSWSRLGPGWDQPLISSLVWWEQGSHGSSRTGWRFSLTLMSLGWFFSSCHNHAQTGSSFCSSKPSFLPLAPNAGPGALWAGESIMSCDWTLGHPDSGITAFQRTENATWD